MGAGAGVRLEGNDVFSAQEVSDLLGIPMSTVYNWRARGLGPRGFRIGRHLKFLRVDVEKWLNEQRAR